MLSVVEAQKKMIQTIRKGPVGETSLMVATARVLAKDLHSPCDMPLFNNSAMDGFALPHTETKGANEKIPSVFQLVERIAAGDWREKPLKTGEAAPVMTGAMVPPGATAVVPKEEVTVCGDTLRVRQEIKEGAHCRYRGEEFKKGDPVLAKGTLVTPGAVGLLASLGFQRIPIYLPPKISIFPTGSELVYQQEDLTPGKILESSSFSLRAALREIRLEAAWVTPVADSKIALSETIHEGLQRDDFIIITGGVSVGKFDYVKEVLTDLGVETVFWKVAQKPGKPLYFGKKENTFVFGLPGNPSSTLVCFYEYVRPALLKWLGLENGFLKEAKGTLAGNFSNKGSRFHFVRAFAEQKNGKIAVIPLEGQESHKMKAFALSNCFFLVPGETVHLNAGEEVMIHWLPSF